MRSEEGELILLLFKWSVRSTSRMSVGTVLYCHCSLLPVNCPLLSHLSNKVPRDKSIPLLLPFSHFRPDQLYSLSYFSSYFQNTLYVSIIPSICIRNSSYSACVPGVKPRSMLKLSRRFDVHCSRRIEGEPYINPRYKITRTR